MNALHQQMDDMGDWAMQHHDRHSAPVPSQDEMRRNRIIAETVCRYRANPHWFDAERWPDDIYANQAQVVADVECCPSLWQRARQWIHDAFGV